jgi:uncharacterized protein with von Willebrand factor type A (vWA) domain
MTSDLIRHTVRFCRELRARGVHVTPAESELAARVLGAVDISDSDELRLALRTALVNRREDFALFDATFDELWSIGRPTRSLTRPGRSETRTTRSPDSGKIAQVTLSNWMRSSASSDEEPIQMRTASEREALGRKDFSSFGNSDAEEFRRLAARIARPLALRPSRRWKSARRGPRLDLRRTVRQSLRTGGDPITLERRRRKIRRTRLVALCDVSGSMELYARFLLQFLHALQNTFARVDTFVFSTRLTRTTDALRGARWEDALRGIARDVTDWSGGTRIGASLAAFVDEWLPLVDSRTIVLILSDGWETGDPQVLAEALETLHRRAGRVIWLNPLMGSGAFAPESRGMVAALPHIDLLAPGHNIESLQRLVNALVI